jgi:hypothetical protein
MKVERKLSDFSVEKLKHNENMKTETKICRTKTYFFGRSGNRNGTAFSGRTDAEMEVSVFGQYKISILWLFYMANLAGLICDLVILNYQSNLPLLPHYTE